MDMIFDLRKALDELNATPSPFWPPRAEVHTEADGEPDGDDTVWIALAHPNPHVTRHLSPEEDAQRDADLWHGRSA